MHTYLNWHRAEGGLFHHWPDEDTEADPPVPAPPDLQSVAAPEGLPACGAEIAALSGEQFNGTHTESDMCPGCLEAVKLQLGQAPE